MAGRLSVGLVEAPGNIPEVRGVAPGEAPPGQEIEITAQIADDGDLSAPRSRWDFDYDGIWDTEWLDGSSTPFVFPEGASEIVLKVEVMDADGWTDAGLFTITEGPPLPVSGGGGGEDDGCGCRVAGTQVDPPPWWLAALALSGLCRRRPRRRGSRSRRRSD